MKPSFWQADVAQDDARDEQPRMPVVPERDLADSDAQPHVDPTAELLGRAKSRRPRAKAAAPEAPAKKRKAPAAKRPSRSKKSASGDDDSIGNQ